MLAVTVEATVVENAQQIENAPFEGLPPQMVHERLRKLKEDEIVGGKLFWKSYEKWEKLTQQQKTNTVVFVNSKLCDLVRGKFYDDIRTDMANEVREEKARQAYTNKHDKARLLHIRKDPKFAGVWQRALDVKSRTELDADQHQDNAACWTELVQAFNNYKDNAYKNACVCEGKASAAGTKIAVEGMEQIFDDCHDIDPTSLNRPERDAKWVRISYREIKSLITLCSERYRRSGNQEAENEYDEWIKFSRRSGHDIVTYARALFSDLELQQIGRAIRDDVSRDTGALPKNDAVTAAATAAENTAWKENRQAKKRKASCLSNDDGIAESISGINSLSVASVLQTTLTTQLLLEHGDSAMKQRIVNDLTMAYNKARVGCASTPARNAAKRQALSTPDTISSSITLTDRSPTETSMDGDGNETGSDSAQGSDSEDEDD